MEIYESKNIYGRDLITCSTDPVTGFYRDCKCNTGDDDQGMHTVCVELTSAFLDYSKSQGNDLSTPRPDFGFNGLKAGDHWCLCAGRWLDAYRDGMAPKVNLHATHEETLSVIPRHILEEFAL